MTLLAGLRLNSANQYFSEGDPVQCGSSYDLTVGQIIDGEGKSIPGPYILKPGHMVQVVTKQVFRLPKTVTGHVTCKTTLTRDGIWALTVGIVDPGWDAPIATTLLNFGKVDHVVQIGDKFLRVSFFEHAEVEEKFRRTKPNELNGYINSVRKNAAAFFPKTFLDTKKISQEAGETAVRGIRNQFAVWLPVVAVLFAVLQLFVAFAPSYLPGWGGASLEQLHEVEAELQMLRVEVDQLENYIEANAPP
ncbi:hypothetical protein KUW17_05630 [Leisingera aquaemixtae]|uniref:dCTP deaminase domain-containing protein n=1 Tax=Leisingera aquaemixtae TaxID=1396826 RepID=UPI001C97E15F|nr:hypothetical protein [Leisingera aquaemixtae]MBY6066213.1 hypothetical protein [Leisingera aquaemixtae]